MVSGITVAAQETQPPTIAETPKKATSFQFLKFAGAAGRRQKLLIAASIMIAVFIIVTLIRWENNRSASQTEHSEQSSDETKYSIYDEPIRRMGYESLLKKATEGDFKSQYDLGVMYRNGDSVSQNLAKAVVWWQKSALQGNVDAQVSLGGAYAIGDGVPKDYAQAVKWIQKAAVQGNTKEGLNK